MAPPPRSRARRAPLPAVLVRASICASICAAVAVPRPARALDPFEIQVYDGTANPAGAIGIELHLNHVATGNTQATAPELPLLGQTHATLEPSYGVFPWWEVGGYFQTARLPNGEVDYAGAKLRSKFVAPPTFHRNLRLGLNLEVSYLPAAFDRNRWGAEIRPIVGWADDHWLFIVNPILDLSLAGPDASGGPSFEPAVKLGRSILETFSVGVEYYGNVGPIASPFSLAAQDHLFFGALDIEAFPAVEINLGLGGGVTPASAGLVGKVILGYTFDLRKAPPAPAAK